MRLNTTGFAAVTSVIVLILNGTASAHLHPGQGRFVQRDGVGPIDGYNLYQYERSAVITHRDPSGNLCQKQDCCCLEELTLRIVGRSNDPEDGIPCSGHTFRVNIRFKRGQGQPNQKTECTLEWWERTNLPTHADYPADQWYDAHAITPNASTFNPWRLNIGDLPDEIVITDKPCMVGGADRVRYLEWAITVKSAPHCNGCRHDALTVTAFQELHLVNGQVDYAQSGIVSPAGAITPGQP